MTLGGGSSPSQRCFMGGLLDGVANCRLRCGKRKTTMLRLFDTATYQGGPGVPVDRRTLASRLIRILFTADARDKYPSAHKTGFGSIVN